MIGQVMTFEGQQCVVLCQTGAKSGNMATIKYLKSSKNATVDAASLIPHQGSPVSGTKQSPPVRRGRGRPPKETVKIRSDLESPPRPKKLFPEKAWVP